MNVNYSQCRLYYVENVIKQTRVFEVFNVKVRLLHDSSSYQTIRRQLLLFRVIANAISSLYNYRKGAAKTEPAP